MRCAEGVGHEGLLPLIEPDPLWVAARVTRAEITAITGDQINTLRAEGGQGYVLERRVFDRVLAERATQAGAEVRVKTSATGLLKENGQVRGVRLQRGDFFTGVLARLRKRLQVLGAQRKQLGKLRYWDLKPDFEAGEVITL